MLCVTHANTHTQTHTHTHACIDGAAGLGVRALEGACDEEEASIFASSRGVSPEGKAGLPEEMQRGIVHGGGQAGLEGTQKAGGGGQQGYASCDWTVAWSVRNAQLNSAVVVAGSTAVAVGLVCMYVCMHIYVYCTCVHVCACVYVCVCVCVCVYIHIDIDIYIGVISLSGLARPGAVFTFFFYLFFVFFYFI